MMDLESSPLGLPALPALPALFVLLPAVLAIVGGCAAAQRTSDADPGAALQTGAVTSADRTGRRGGDASPSPAFHWPVPEGWRSETIPFPLAFAPELPYRGVEELRFGPRFFDPSSETYFSYSFVWLVEPTERAGESFTADTLARDLDVYFTGLARAVAPKTFDPNVHHVRIEPMKGGTYRGVVETVDAFGDGRALTLAVEGEPVLCGARRGVLLSLSPHTLGDAVWTALTEHRHSFECWG